MNEALVECETRHRIEPKADASALLTRFRTEGWRVREFEVRYTQRLEQFQELLRLMRQKTAQNLQEQAKSESGLAGLLKKFPADLTQLAESYLFEKKVSLEEIERDIAAGRATSARLQQSREHKRDDKGRLTRKPAHIAIGIKPHVGQSDAEGADMQQFRALGGSVDEDKKTERKRRDEFLGEDEAGKKIAVLLEEFEKERSLRRMRVDKTLRTEDGRELKVVCDISARVTGSGRSRSVQYYLTGEMEGKTATQYLAALGLMEGVSAPSLRPEWMAEGVEPALGTQAIGLALGSVQEEERERVQQCRETLNQTLSFTAGDKKAMRALEQLIGREGMRFLTRDALPQKSQRKKKAAASAPGKEVVTSKKGKGVKNGKALPKAG